MSLPTQKAGADGVATWDWSPSDIGLTLGHWDVTITAESGSRHEVVHEAIGLDVVA